MYGGRRVGGWVGDCVGQWWCRHNVKRTNGTDGSKSSSGTSSAIDIEADASMLASTLTSTFKTTSSTTSMATTIQLPTLGAGVHVGGQANGAMLTAPRTPPGL